MKVLPQATVLRAAMDQISEALDGEPKNSLLAKRIRRIVQAALEETSKPDPLMAAAVALATSVEVLAGELREAAIAMKDGKIWVCIETPGRLEEARKAIAAARAAGVTL